MPSLLHHLAAYRPFSTLVVGDFMLDQHVYGAAERLSPDAPVPVLHHDHVEDRPGGASNVALCLRALEAEVQLLGVCGDDDEGRALCGALAAAGCATDGIRIDPARPTTLKRSFIGLAQHRHPQKMFRVDFESRASARTTTSSREQMLRRGSRRGIDERRRHLPGGLRQGRVHAEPLCQPRHRALGRQRRQAHSRRSGGPSRTIREYRGATALTPNRTEAERATGLDTPIDASELHNAGLAATNLLEANSTSTRSSSRSTVHGALLEERGGAPQLIPTVARAVYDVTGAGDMVLAALAAGVANGFSWPHAVEFANAAAGLEVEHFGVTPIPLAQIHREILLRDRGLDGKVRTLDELRVELAVHRDAGHSIVFTNGCFDVLHAGHVGYLREARKQGDLLVVGVNADAQVRAQKGANRPVYPIADRLAVLTELQCVDYAVEFAEPTAHDLLRAIRPNIYVKGGDYAPDEINEYDLVQELGIDLRLLAHRPGLGSTQVIEKLNQ